MQHHQLSEAWISLFSVRHHVAQYKKDIQLDLEVAMVSTSITFMFLVLQQAVPRQSGQRDIRSNTEFCIVFVLMRAMFHKVKTVSITIYAYPLF